MPIEITVIDRVEIIGNRIPARLKALKAQGLIKTHADAARLCGLTMRQFQRAKSGSHNPQLAIAFALVIGLQSTFEELFIVKVHRLKIRQS